MDHMDRFYRLKQCGSRCPPGKTGTVIRVWAFGAPSVGLAKLDAAKLSPLLTRDHRMTPG